ncbi:unnamed protein product [Prorocentrum cordatum]|uniref:Uncharacterized protein n=1 Tax=Prorocentrum cordatum TaxID=2364126 RepID=A0ABN9X3L5_9DINO|nr:unnamed protein product [Polarella glacialis]
MGGQPGKVDADDKIPATQGAGQADEAAGSPKRRAGGPRAAGRPVRTGALLAAALVAAGGAGTTVCLIFFAQMNSLALFLSFLFLALGSASLLLAACASTLWARRRRASAAPCALLALGLLGFMAATAVQLGRGGPDAPAPRLVGDAERLFGDGVDVGDDSYSEFRIPALVATDARLVAFAEGRRGVTGVHGDFAETELVFRTRPTAAAGAAPGVPAVSLAGPLQTVLTAPPRGASWAGVGPPASLFLAEEGVVLVPLYYAWTRKPELFDGLDSFGMTLSYDLDSGEWSTPCEEYGGSKGQVNEHQYFSYGGEVWAFARTINYNPWNPRRTLLRRGSAGSSDNCFEVVAQPRFFEQLQGCEGSVLTVGENGSERVFYTGVDGSVLYRSKLQLFEAQTGGGAGQPAIAGWTPLATLHGGGAAYSGMAVVDGGLLGVLYERSDEAALSFHPTDIVLHRVNISAATGRRLAPSRLRNGRGAQ